MKLRPHHALCIHKFTGHGYDERFTEHMTAICGLLRTSPDTAVTIVSGCDELCSVCPNNLRGRCSSLEKAGAMDSGVLNALGLRPGQTLPWSALSAAAREAVFGTEKFENICRSCEWFGLCLVTDI